MVVSDQLAYNLRSQGRKAQPFSSHGHLPSRSARLLNQCRVASSLPGSTALPPENAAQEGWFCLYLRLCFRRPRCAHQVFSLWHWVEVMTLPVNAEQRARAAHRGLYETWWGSMQFWVGRREVFFPVGMRSSQGKDIWPEIPDNAM